MEHKHAEKYQQLNATEAKPKSNKQPKLTDFEPYAKGSMKNAALTSAVMKFIATDMQPINVVNKKGFRALVTALDPRYKLPSYSTFKRDELPKLYCEVSSMTP